MAITFDCPGCGEPMRAKDRDAGRRVRCDECGKAFTIPDPEGDSAPADDPSPEEAPPRRFRRPALPPSTNRLVWVGVVLGVLGVVVVGAVALLLATRSGRQGWQAFDSARGGYSVELPGEPRDDMANRLSVPRGTMQAEGTTRRDWVYAVMWQDMPGPPNPLETDERVIDETVRGMRTGFAVGEVVPRDWLKVDGFTARDVEMVGPDGTVRTRVVLAEGRLYVAMAGGPGATAADPDVARFLDSFRVTDPQLLAAGKRRAEEAERARKFEEERKAEELRRQEEARRLQEEARKLEQARLEADLRRRGGEWAATAVLGELERLAAANARREAEAAATAFRTAPAAVAAPNPATLKGLKVHLPFENIGGNSLRGPGGSLMVPHVGSEFGTGVRGTALYLLPDSKGLTIPFPELPGELIGGDCTVTGWVRTRGPGVDLLKVSAGPGWGELLGLGVTAGGKAWGQVSTVSGHFYQRHPGEMVAGRLSGPAPDDDKWHHVALVRHTGEGRAGAALYVDAVPVAYFVFPAGTNKAPASVLVAVTGPGGSKLPPDLPAVAVDDLCVFDRSLSAAELRYLAGKAKTPDEPQADAVRLVPQTAITPNAGVAFDPERKAVWAVSTFGWVWSNEDRGPRPEVGKRQAISCLVRYTYPDFAFDGAWLMPGGGKGLFLSANSPLLDAKNNRLYARTLRGGSTINDLQATESIGTLVRIDLGDLPKYDPKAGPVEPPATEGRRGPASPAFWGDMVVSPDGEFLYTGLSRPAVRELGRVPSDLSAEAVVLQAQKGEESTGLLRVSADGKTLFTVVSGGRNGTPSLQAIDAVAWKVGEPQKLPEQETLRWADRVAFGPDGRLWVSGPESVVSVDPETGTRRQYAAAFNRGPPSRVTMVPSADGRFLFLSEAGTKRNRFFVLDARKDATRFDPLAVLEESPGVRVGGPFGASPDGRFVVFRSGVVVRVETGEEATKPLPDPQPLPTPKDPLAVGE